MTWNRIEFDELTGFKRDVKRHLKKYGTLVEDIGVARKVLSIMPGPRPFLSFRLQHPRNDVEVIKMRITSRSDKGSGVNSGLHLVYALFKTEPRIVMMGLVHVRDWEAEEVKVLQRRF